MRKRKDNLILSKEHTQHVVMPQMSKKTEPTRTTNRTKDMENSIAETEVETTMSILKESMMIKKLGATQKDPDFPAECVQKPLTQIY